MSAGRIEHEPSPNALDSNGRREDERATQSSAGESSPTAGGGNATTVVVATAGPCRSRAKRTAGRNAPGARAAIANATHSHRKPLLPPLGRITKSPTSLAKRYSEIDSIGEKNFRQAPSC